MEIKAAVLRMAAFHSRHSIFHARLSGITLWLLALSTAVLGQDHTRFQARTHTSSTVTLVYRLFVPPNYVASRRYPLVVALHGVGERGNDNQIQVDREDIAKPWIADSMQNRVPHFVLIPQCPASLTWGGSADASLSAAAQGIVQILDSLKREFSLDTTRFYITGLSMGGAGTYHFLKLRPNLFAAAVPCAGRGDTTAAATIARTPFWDFHGAVDGSVPVSGSRDIVARMERLGNRVVRFVSQAYIVNPSMTAYGDAIRTGTSPVTLVANIPNIPWDSLTREVNRGAPYLYSEITNGDHRTGWMVAYHNPLVTPWLFSKTKGASVSISAQGGRRTGSGVALFRGWRDFQSGSHAYSLLGRGVVEVHPDLGRYIQPVIMVPGL